MRIYLVLYTEKAVSYDVLTATEEGERCCDSEMFVLWYRIIFLVDNCFSYSKSFIVHISTWEELKKNQNSALIIYLFLRGVSESQCSARVSRANGVTLKWKFSQLFPCSFSFSLPWGTILVKIAVCIVFV